MTSHILIAQNIQQNSKKYGMITMHYKNGKKRNIPIGKDGIIRQMLYCAQLTENAVKKQRPSKSNIHTYLLRCKCRKHFA